MDPQPGHLLILGKRIRALRRERGLTQEELAERVGAHSNHISKIERGIVTNIGLDLLEKIAAVLNINSSKLLERALNSDIEKAVENIQKQFYTLPPEKILLLEKLIESWTKK